MLELPSRKRSIANFANRLMAHPDRPFKEPALFRGRVPVQPGAGSHLGLTRHVTPHSDRLPQHVTPDQINQPVEKQAHTRRESSYFGSPSVSTPPLAIPERPAAPAPPKHVDHDVSARRGSAASQALSTASSIRPPPANPYALRKWDSADDYIKASGDHTDPPPEAADPVDIALSQGGFRRATITVPSEFPLPAHGNAPSFYSRRGSSRASMASDLDSDAGRSSTSHLARSTAPTPDTAASHNKPLPSLPTANHRRASSSTYAPSRPTPSSALDELRSLHADLSALITADNRTERRHLKDMMAMATTLGRDEALNDVSAAMRRRAGARKTLGRAERLMLEREADGVFRMTSEVPESVVHARVDVLEVERDGTRAAVASALEGLLERACAIVGAAVLGGAQLGGGPPASRSRY